MRATRINAALGILGCWLLLAGQGAQGQVLQSGVSNQAARDLSTPALKYFGRGMPAPATRPQQSWQAPSRPPFQLAGGKPFQNISRPPTISPYNSLDAIESSVSLPNYYSRVLPQIKQQQARQAQSLQLRRLQQQVRLANAPAAISNNRSGSVPTTGYRSQFLNVGGYFPTVQR